MNINRTQNTSLKEIFEFKLTKIKQSLSQSIAPFSFFFSPLSATDVCVRVREKGRESDGDARLWMSDPIDEAFA